MNMFVRVHAWSCVLRMPMHTQQARGGTYERRTCAIWMNIQSYLTNLRYVLKTSTSLSLS